MGNSNLLWVVVMALVIALAGYREYAHTLDVQDLRDQVQNLQQEKLSLQERLDSVSEELAQEQASSVGAVLDDANSTLKKTWRAALDTLSEQVERAKSALETQAAEQIERMEQQKRRDEQAEQDSGLESEQAPVSSKGLAI
jgi:biopolymer transport protein ExbB/TolQ